MLATNLPLLVTALTAFLLSVPAERLCEGRRHRQAKRFYDRGLQVDEDGRLLTFDVNPKVVLEIPRETWSPTQIPVIARLAGLLDRVSDRTIGVILGIATVILAACCFAPMTTVTQALGAVLLVSAMYIARSFADEEANDVARVITLAIGVLLTVRYLGWRGFYTLGTHDPVSAVCAYLLFLAELFAGILHVLNCVVNVSPIRRKDLRVRDLPAGTVLPTVDVLVPSYNEDADMLAVTIRAALSMDYPPDKLRVHLLDDGGTDQKVNDPDPIKAAAAMARRLELQALCRQVGANYITRARNLHAKAGNLNNALPHTSGELLVILDADHVPALDFLDRTVPWFLRDAGVFLVQTPHFMVNPDPIDRNLLQSFRRMPAENDMFYRTIQRGLDFWSGSFFCGSAAVLRRRCVEEIGGISGESITEDAESALEMHSRGYRSVYVERPMVAGLAPETFTAFVVQRMRWAQGMTQILLLKKPYQKQGLNWQQRICYMSSLLFWQFPFYRMIFILSPLAYLCFGLDVFSASLEDIVAYTLPHFIVTFMISNLLYGPTRWPLISELYEMMQCIFTFNAIVQVFRNPRKPSFVVTPKKETIGDKEISPLSKPFYILGTLLVFGFVLGGWRWYGDIVNRGRTTVVLLWNIFNFMTVFAALGALLERGQRRASPRMPANQDGRVALSEQLSADCFIDDLSAGGARLLVDRKLAPPKKGDLVSITVHSRPAGRDITVRGEVKAVFNVRNFHGIGVGFVSDNEVEARDIVTVVYGDSGRWVAFQERRCRRISHFKALQLAVILSRRPVLEHLMIVTKKIRLLIPSPRRFIKIAIAARTAAILMVTVMACAVAVSPAAARGKAPPPPPPVQSEATRGAIPLNTLLAGVNPLLLAHSTASADIPIPLADNVKVNDAVLALAFTNSATLLANRSVLSVRFNGSTLGQIQLDPHRPLGSASIRLPRDLWRSGANRLTLSVTQHYTDQACENPRAPDLWTEIDTARSRITYDVESNGRTLLLSDLSGLFSSGLGGQSEVTILTAGGDTGAVGASALPLLAQALALRHRPAPLVISYAPWRQGGAAVDAPAYLPVESAGGVHVLAGTAEQLAAILPAAALKPPEGPELVIQAAGGKHYRLIVTGRTAEEVVAAARALATIDDPLTADSQATFPIQPLHPLVNRQRLEDDKVFTFKSLGLDNTTVSGTSAAGIDLPFVLPADFYTDDAADAEVNLDFAYTAGMGTGSAANIAINGVFVHGVPLDEGGGESFHHYRVQVPTRHMVPGINHLVIATNIFPNQIKDQCQDNLGQTLSFQILGRSSIRLPVVGRLAQLPDLALLARTGYPYVFPDAQGEGEQIVVENPRLIGAGLTLLGKIAQVAGAPVDGIHLSVGGVGSAKGHVLLIAADNHLAPEVFGEWSAALGRIKLWPYQALNGLRALRRGEDTDLASLLPWRFGEAAVGDRSFGIRQKSGLGNLGVLIALRNPAASAPYLLTILSAESDEVLNDRVKDLIRADTWTQLRGDLVTWTDRQNSLFSMEVADRFEIGRRNMWLILRALISRNPWYWLGTIGLAVIVFTACVVVLLRRRRRRVFQDITR